MRNSDEIARRIESLDAEILLPEALQHTISLSVGLKLVRDTLQWVLAGGFKVENIGTDKIEIMAFELHDGRSLVVWIPQESIDDAILELRYEILDHPCSLCHINEAEDGHVCQRCKAIGGS
jgi:hypothetical protein